MSFYVMDGLTMSFPTDPDTGETIGFDTKEEAIAYGEENLQDPQILIPLRWLYEVECEGCGESAYLDGGPSE